MQSCIPRPFRIPGAHVPTVNSGGGLPGQVRTPAPLGQTFDAPQGFSVGPRTGGFNDLFCPALSAACPTTPPPLPCTTSGQISSRFSFQPHPVKTNPHRGGEWTFAGPPLQPVGAPLVSALANGSAGPLARPGGRGAAQTPCSLHFCLLAGTTTALPAPAADMSERARLLLSVLNLHCTPSKEEMPLPTSRKHLFPQSPPSGSRCASTWPRGGLGPAASQGLRFGGERGQCRLFYKC